MLDHVSIPVANLAKSAEFYDAVLGTLQLHRLKQREGAIGYGPKNRQAPVFWIIAGDSASTTPRPGFHVSFQAAARQDVDNFHAEAVTRGAPDAGKPGWRPQYTMPFYGAFVLDPDGFKIEAVCRLPK